jgi:hypothetical protein
MHGISRDRNLDAPLPSNSLIKRVVVRYSDGHTLSFHPETGREFYSEDDIENLVHVLDHASGVAEWTNVSEENPDEG